MKQIDIGTLVKKIMDDRHMRYNTLATYLGTNRSNITKLLNKPDWRVSEVLAASECIKQNLFTFFVPAKSKAAKKKTAGNSVMSDTLIYRLLGNTEELESLRKQIVDKDELLNSLRAQVELQKEKIRNLQLTKKGS